MASFFVDCWWAWLCLGMASGVYGAGPRIWIDLAR